MSAALDLAVTPGGRVGDASPLGTKPGGKRRLDDYVRMVAHALMRKRGFTKSHAIATAKNAIRRWGRGGAHTKPAVRAGALASRANQARLDAGLRLSTAQCTVVDLALAEADRRAFLDFAAYAGLKPDELDFVPGAGDVELGANHPPPYRYRHGWIPLEHVRVFRGHRTEPTPSPASRRPSLLHRAVTALRERKRSRTLEAAMAEQRRRAARTAAIQAALLEDARRFITNQAPVGPRRLGRRQLRRKLRGAPLKAGSFLDSPGMIGGAASFSEAQQAMLDLAVLEAAGRDIELAPHWKHGWIPLNEEALAIKLKRGGGEGTPAKKDSFGKFRTAQTNPLAHIKDDKHLDTIYRAHVAQTDRKLIELGLTHATHLTHAHDNGDGSYDWSKDPERAALHAKIVDNVYRRQAATAKADKQALFLGGLPGAGKSTALGKLPGIEQRDYITVNPDIFKEELAKHGLVPKVAGMAPMEASGLVHEESSHLANMLAEKARRNNKNIAYDITMNSDGSVYKRLKPLDESGYTARAVFVDIPFEMSQQRVQQRHRRGWEKYIRDKSGTDLGQRLVPSSHVNSGRSKTGSTSANFDAFQAVKHRFAAYHVYDNSGKDPRLVDSHGSF